MIGWSSIIRILPSIEGVAFMAETLAEQLRKSSDGLKKYLPTAVQN
jgi:hypothetical protein